MKTLILQEHMPMLERFRELVKLFSSVGFDGHKFKKIGAGSYREVIKLLGENNFVIKYQERKTNSDGMNSNLLEFKNYQNMSKLGRQFLAASYYYHEFDNGSSILISEYVQGDTLRQVYKDKQIPNSLVGRFEFCQAVEDTLRRFGLSCTDISEDNIIIPSSGVGFKVVDYSD